MGSPTQKITRKQAKAQSRRRLIGATIDVLREDGPAGLTTGRIARAAGLSQPSFYVHFKDMDEALAAAADEIGLQLRAALTEERRKVVEERSRETLYAAFLSALNAFLDNHVFTEVMLRYRRDGVTPLGQRVQAIVDAIRDDIIMDCRARGLDENRLPDLYVFVDLMLGMIFAVVEGLLDRRYVDRRECAEVLFRATISVYSALATR